MTSVQNERKRSILAPEYEQGIGGLTAAQVRQSRQERRLSASLATRTRRAGGILELSTAQVLHLQNSMLPDNWQFFKDFIPVSLWLAWLLCGTVFYALHDNYSWTHALYLSVDTGWSLAWPLLDHQGAFATPASRLFTSVHTTIGVLFIVVIVLYMAEELSKRKEKWLVDIATKKEFEQAMRSGASFRVMWNYALYHLPRYRVIGLFTLWAAAGILWGRICIKEWNFAESVNFTISTVTGAGYLAIPKDSSSSTYLFVALYTSIGVPLTKIALGFLASLVMYSSDEQQVFQKIIADVTTQEIHFMNLFGIDDGDGRITNKEYIILIVVRLGAVRPELITTLHQRFREMDRKNKGHIEYDELMFNGLKITARERFQRAVRRVAALAALTRSTSASAVAKVDAIQGLASDTSSATHTTSKEHSHGYQQSPCRKVHCLDTDMEGAAGSGLVFAKDGLSVNGIMQSTTPRPRSNTIDSLTSSGDLSTPKAATDGVVSACSSDAQAQLSTASCTAIAFTPRGIGSIRVGAGDVDLISPVNPQSPASNRRCSAVYFTFSDQALSSDMLSGDADKDDSDGDNGVSLLKADESRWSSDYDSLTRGATEPVISPQTICLPRPSYQPSKRVIVDRLASIESMASTCDDEAEIAEIPVFPCLDSGINSGEAVVDDPYSSDTVSSSTFGSSKKYRFSGTDGTGPEFNAIDDTTTSDVEEEKSVVVDNMVHIPAESTAGRSTSASSRGSSQRLQSGGYATSCTGMSSFLDDAEPGSITDESMDEHTQTRIADSRLSIYDVAVAAVRQRRLSVAFREKHIARIRRVSLKSTFLRMFSRRSARTTDVEAGSVDSNEEEERDGACVLNGCVAVCEGVVQLVMYDHYAQAMLAWLLWILSGTFFYALSKDMTVADAFYTSMSVGYAVFWVDLKYTSPSALYTVCHMLAGCIATATVMAVFALSLTDNKEGWYLKARRRERLELAFDSGELLDDVVAALEYYWPKLRVHVLLLLWIALGVLWSCLRFDWALADGIFFTFTTLSAAGLHPIPEEEARGVDRGFVAIYMSIGIPLMAVSLGMAITPLINFNKTHISPEDLYAPVTEEELRMMRSFGIEDGNGSLDAREYIILILLRIGAISPELVCIINQQFADIDTEGLGSVTYEKITQVHIPTLILSKHTKKEKVGDADTSLRKKTKTEKRKQ